MQDDAILRLVVYFLATWRISSLIVHEKGPGGLFLHLRELAGITHDEDGKAAIIPETFLGELFTCVWCSSIWIGIVWVVFEALFPQPAFYCGLVFALSAGAIVMDKWIS